MFVVIWIDFIDCVDSVVTSIISLLACCHKHAPPFVSAVCATRSLWVSSDHTVTLVFQTQTVNRLAQHEWLMFTYLPSVNLENKQPTNFKQIFNHIFTFCIFICRQGIKMATRTSWPWRRFWMRLNFLTSAWNRNSGSWMMCALLSINLCPTLFTHKCRDF